ncbi:MAG TPA: 2-amino-4-hydroxy-6-hydroxymethyldihydropteridine diphosphokinase [Thermoanaerobaculia bacterium]|nr:2-amino-4-hydroxy-6-hydroxymethyldihydropteridine diphosphokinase [Thermoanaerobaculia bacterium]
MTSTSSRSVIIALGSNLGDRAYNLRRAIHEMHDVVRIVRVSTIHETEPIDAPAGSPRFLNMAVAGYTRLAPLALLDALQRIESRLGRIRRIRNAPRTIDLDLILYDAVRMRTPRLTLPHPRAHEREFVMAPLREITTVCRR